MYGIEVCTEPFATLESDTKDHHCSYCFKSLKDYLFAPKEFYITSGDKPIVFDSGHLIAVNPHLDDFVGEAKKFKKEMTRLSSVAQVEGEGIVNWVFYDDYRVIQNLKIKACYMPSSTVRLFSS